MWLPRGSSALDAFGHVSAFVFAYQGHSVILEIMREMEEPRSFPRAAITANAMMILIYVSTCVLGYHAFGADVAGFLPDSMQPGAAKSVVGLLLTLHTAVAYMVTAQPLHRSLHGWLFPETLETSSTSSARACMHWALLSSGQLLLSVLLATAVPFFADLQALLGSLTGAPMIFGFPALFFLRARHANGLPIRWADLALCGLFLAVLTPLFLVIGTMSSVQSILRNWQAAQATSGEPPVTSGPGAFSPTGADASGMHAVLQAH